MSDPHPFDTATLLEPLGDGRFRGETSDAYRNLAGPFGGITAALLMKAALDDERRRGDPVSFTVNFCKGIADGPFEVATRLERGGKYVQHWSLRLTQGDEVCTTATLIFGMRNDTLSHQEARMPRAAAPEDCAELETSALMNWVQRYRFRFSEGAPAFSDAPWEELGDSRSVVWVDDRQGRPLDYPGLAAFSDSFFLRLVHMRGALSPMGTVSLTTQFHAPHDEVAAQGAAPLLGVAWTSRVHAHFHDQQMQLWGGDGRLLATGTQIVWFRE